MATLSCGRLKLALMSGLVQFETTRFGFHFEVWTPLLKVSQWDWGRERTADNYHTVNLWLGPFLVSVWRPMRFA